MLLVNTLADLQHAASRYPKRIVAMTAKWCRPCREMEGTLIRLANEYPTVECFKVDVDDAPDIADYYGTCAPPPVFCPPGNMSPCVCVCVCARAPPTPGITAIPRYFGYAGSKKYVVEVADHDLLAQLFAQVAAA